MQVGALGLRTLAACLAIVLTACSLECWRQVDPGSRAVPMWQANSLWERTHPLRVDADATWVPFGFELPDGLPPAIEASTIAWRYELRAHRKVWHWFEETAALTPLLHEHA